MNSQSVTLLSVLTRCNPQDADLQRECKIQKILHSKDYAEISKRTIFASHFQELFSLEKLRSYSNRQLSTVAKVLPLIPTVLADLVRSLKNGAAPELTTRDMPDFMDKDSLEDLISKLHCSSGKNYCNIAADDFMAIFEKDTVKRINEDYFCLPADNTDYESVLAAFYGNKKYCISSREIQEKEQEYQEKIARLKGEIQTAKKKKRSRWFLRGMLGVVAIFVPSLVASFSGLLSSSAVAVGTIIAFLATLLFLIGG